jgi:hypothetical protein
VVGIAVTRRKRQRPEEHDRSEFRDRNQVHHPGRRTHPDVVEQTDPDDRDGGDLPDGRRIEVEEVAEIFGEDRRDGTQGRRPQHGELGPAKQKCGQWAERFEQERKDAPERGSAAASSATVSAPVSAMVPPSTHASITAPGTPRIPAVPAGTRKMPLPMVMPTNTAPALHNPSRRCSRSPQGSRLDWVRVSVTA